MDVELFVVIAEDQTAERQYEEIIHREFPLSRYVSKSVIDQEFTSLGSTLGERFDKLLFDNPKIIPSNIYFFLFPPASKDRATDFWKQLDNRLLGYISQDMVSVWAIRSEEFLEHHVDRTPCIYSKLHSKLLPFARYYTDQHSLESELKQFVRSIKLYNREGQRDNRHQSADNSRFEKRLFKHLFTNLFTKIFDSYNEKPFDEGRENPVYLGAEGTTWGNLPNTEIPNPPFEKTVIITKERDADMATITIFGASEADDYVRELCLNLNQTLLNRSLPSPFTCTTWRNPAIFGTGSDTINALIQYANEGKVRGDYAVFLFSPDDTATIRKKEYFVSRDNVWLEYGLFSAILGPSNVFAVFPENPVCKDDKQMDWHHPSDFATQKTPYQFFEKEHRDIYLKLVATEIADKISCRLNKKEIPKEPHREKKDPPRFNPLT